MAEFFANVRVDMTGKSASGQTGVVTIANSQWIQIQ